MAEKPKAKTTKLTDKKQSERFIQAARKLECDESGKKFEEVLRKVLPKRNSG